MPTLKEQIEITKKALEPEQDMHTALIEFCILIERFYNYLEEKNV